MSREHKSSLNDMRTQVAKVIGDVAELTRKTSVNHQQINSFFRLIGDTESKIEALKAIGIRDGIWSEDQFEDALDEVRQIRKRTMEEQIADGDFMRIDYKAEDQNGLIVMEEKDFPYRVTGAMMFDEHLVGKTVAEAQAAQKFNYTYPEKYDANPALAGKALTFQLSVAKVKTNTKEAADAKQ
jgi:hypothetical protein